MLNYSVFRDEAVRTLLENRQRGIANLYFAAGVHNGAATYTQADFTSLPALFVDLDAGEGKPFRDLDDILAFVLTHPIQRATAAWVSGNGVQMMFRLREPLPFVAASPEAKRIMQVWGNLNDAFIADACDGPQHLFRVPTTLNDKPDRGTTEGYLLWFEPNRTWTLEELEAAALPWLEPEVEDEGAGEPVRVEAGGEIVPYEQLPEAIRDEIEGEHADRSAGMYVCVGKLVSLGYNEATIHAAIRRSPGFMEKFEIRDRRLAQEVDRCLRKFTNSPWRTGLDRLVPLPIRNTANPVALDQCAALDASVAAKIKLYEKIAGIRMHPWVLDAARFHEHVVANNRQGVLLAPCGAGKSTWALAHIAAHAGSGERCLYVVETVRQLYQAADKLAAMTDVPVGRVHAFNPEKCQELCGLKHDWKDCSPKSPDAVCHSCDARNRCAFYLRSGEEAKAVLVMTHAGLVRLVESGSPLLEDARVIVDEDLSVFADWEVSLADLRLVQEYNASLLPWAELFPFSRATAAMSGWDLDERARSFASRCYAYRTHASVGGIRNLRDQLRRMLATELEPNDVFHERAGDREHVRDVLASLVNLLRPSVQGDAAFSFTEAQNVHGEWTYRVRKQRFSLNSERPWASLWILNASAMLTPVEYPPNLPVFTCPDLPEASGMLRLSVIVASPTATARVRKLLLTEASQRFSPQLGQHRRVLIAGAKSDDGIKKAGMMVTGLYPPDAPPRMTGMTRGRIKGANEAGDCTLAILTPMPLFTTVDDYALQASLLLRRSLPRSIVFDNKSDLLKFPAGAFKLPAMQECYALSALDELYQTVWRAAVRNGHPTEVVMSIPDVTWMISLWQTVMPQAQVVSAIALAGPAETARWATEVQRYIAMAEQRTDMPQDAVDAFANQRAAFEQKAPVMMTDHLILGLQSVINMPAGTRITKNDLAALLGYGGKEPWKENMKRIRSLVAPWLEEAGDNVQQMVRLP